MVKKSTYKAFTIAELTISLIIIGLFLLLATNIIVKSTKEKTSKNLHGYYVCYDNNKNSRKHYTEIWYTFGKNSNDDVEKCTFTTPKSAKYLIMNLMGGGAGSNDKYAGQNGEFISKFVSLPDNKYDIIIGNGGAGANEEGKSQNGGDTIVKIEGHTENLFTANGGHALYNPENLEISDISKCVLTSVEGSNCFFKSLRGKGLVGDEYSNDYVCDMTQNCEIVGDNIKISFCGYKSTPRTLTIPFKNKSFDSCKAKDSYGRTDMDKIYSMRRPDPYKFGLISNDCINALKNSLKYKDKNGTEQSVDIEDADDLFNKINLDIAHDKFVRQYYNNALRLKDGVFVYYDFHHMRENLGYIPSQISGTEIEPFDPVKSRESENYWCDGRSSFDVYFYLNQNLAVNPEETKMKNYIDLMKYDIAHKETIGQGAAPINNNGHGGGIIISW